MGQKREKMKLSTFLLGVLAVKAQTTLSPDPRRKKWKEEPTTIDWTTTTTTSTEATTSTTTSTTSPTTKKPSTTTPPPFEFDSNSENAIPGGTKELQQSLFQSPDVASNTGFNFGSNFGLSTKGIDSVIDETRKEELAAAGKGGKKKKKDKTKKDKKDKKDKKEKKDKKDKKKKGGKKGKVDQHECLAKIGQQFKFDPSHVNLIIGKTKMLYKCHAGNAEVSHEIIQCKSGAEGGIELFVDGDKHEPTPNTKTPIVCNPKSTRNVDLSKCTEAAAIEAMDEFNFSS